MLQYDDVYNIYEKKEKFEGVSKNGLNTIDESIALANYEKLEMKRHTKLYELANEDLAYNIRKSVEYWWFDFHVKNALDWITLRRGKIDKRKKYDEKSGYDSLITELQNALEVDGLEILEIVQCGFDAYAYTLKFTIESSDYVFLLNIPIIKKLTVENMLETNYGKLNFGYLENNSYYKYIKNSYNLKDFKDVIIDINASDNKHLFKEDFKLLGTEDLGW